MKRAKKIMGGILAVVGIFAAVTATDGIDYEIAIRFGGIALFALGAYLAEAFDFQSKKA